MGEVARGGVDQVFLQYVAGDALCRSAFDGFGVGQGHGEHGDDQCDESFHAVLFYSVGV